MGPAVLGPHAVDEARYVLRVAEGPLDRGIEDRSLAGPPDPERLLVDHRRRPRAVGDETHGPSVGGKVLLLAGAGVQEHQVGLGLQEGELDQAVGQRVAGGPMVAEDERIGPESDAGAAARRRTHVLEIAGRDAAGVGLVPMVAVAPDVEPELS